MSSQSEPDIKQASPLNQSMERLQEVVTEKQSLWHHPNFLKLWLSETISQFGSQFTGLALPFTAIIFLNAGAAELGFLAFIGSLPWLAFGLIVGGLGDPHRNQTIIASSHILRGPLP